MGYTLVCGLYGLFPGVDYTQDLIYNWLIRATLFNNGFGMKRYTY